MTSTPDPPLSRRRWPVGRAAVRAAGRVFGVSAVLLLSLGAGVGRAGEDASAAAIAQAHAALARGDGIAAEMALRKAMAAGASRDRVAARMGEAFLAQGDLPRARTWLAPARFVPAEAAYGYRVLGRLEMAQGNLAAAGLALDQALRRTPDDSGLWLDVARLRYSGAQHAEAIAATDRALALDPRNVRALEYRGLQVRDAFGLGAALPWFEAGLKLSPDDLGLLAEYAATLGEMGRARDMLAVTRRMLELNPRHERAFYLQAVLAARAGKVGLARGLMARAGAGALETPAGLLLQGTLELQAGNANQAADLLGQLARRQPGNAIAQDLLAQALAQAGDPRGLVDGLAARASRLDASPYLLTQVGRAYEQLGRRDLAAPFLDRAARPALSGFAIAGEEGAASPSVLAVRRLLGAGATGQALANARSARTAAPGSRDAALLDGDARFAAGDVAGAVDAWRAAAGIRMDGGLLRRLVRAYALVDAAQAARVAAGYRAGHPLDRSALRLSASLAAGRGDWRGARDGLTWLVADGAHGDPGLLADLSVAQARLNDKRAAAETAWAAVRIQRGSVAGGEALALVLGSQSSVAASLRRKVAGPLR